MTMHRIRADRDNFLMFYITPQELRSKMGRTCRYNIDRTPKAQPDWVTPDAVFKQDPQMKGADKLPDISYWTTSHMVLNQKAYNVLSSHLKPYGEFLPVNVEGKPYYIFNTLKLVDESFINLDMSEREFEGEGELKMQVGLHKLKFKEVRLKDTLVFKTEYDTYLNIFCGDEFKKMVEMAGLTGLLFKEDLASIF